MRKVLNLLTIFSVGVTSISTTTNVIACGKENNMVKLYELTPKGNNAGWEPAIHEKWLIIEVDKTTIDKYTLEHHNSSTSVEGNTTIVFYFKNKFINNFEHNYWDGPEKAYEWYFSKELDIKPTPYEQWMPVFGYKWVEGWPSVWEKDYKSTESFGVNPQIIKKIFLKQIDKQVKIEIEYSDNTSEKHLQETGNPKEYKNQFENDLKIDHRNIIIEE